MKKVDCKIVVIGAGLQGVHLSASLIGNGHSSLLLIDPYPPCSQWFSLTQGQVMGHLRSGWEMHIDPDKNGLVNFRNGLYPHGSLALTPGLSIFNAHVEDVIQKYSIYKYWEPAMVSSITQRSGLFEIQTTNPRKLFTTEIVILAVGIGYPVMPASSSRRVLHSVQIDVSNFGSESVCIIGGGLTAATLAVNLAGRNIQVCLCAREDLAVSQLEVPVNYLPGSSWWYKFISEDVATRYQEINRARAITTITPNIYSALMSSNFIRVETDPNGVKWTEKYNGVYVQVAGKEERFDHLIFCTGFSVNGLLKQLNVPIDTYGELAVLDSNCESSILNLFVMGRLAELTLGPFGRNIIGARFGAEIIASRINELV